MGAALIRRQYEDGASLLALAAAHGSSSPTIRKQIVLAGGAIRPRGVATGLRDQERAAEIVRLRERDGLTYHEIGTRFGLCGERVRQILSRTGRADLCGPETFYERRRRQSMEDRPCPSCGKIVRRRKREDARFCSSRCFGLSVEQPNKHMAALHHRADGRAWKEAARLAGYANAPQVQMAVKRFAARHGLDISWACQGAGHRPIAAPPGWFEEAERKITPTQAA